MIPARRKVFITSGGVVCRVGDSLDAVLANVGSVAPGADVPPASARIPMGHRMACAAATQAWEAARALGMDAAPERVGLLASTSRGVLPDPVKDPASRKEGLSWLVNTSGGAVSGAVARAVGHRGPAMMLSANCVSSGVAVCMAADLIQSGVWDAALVGGVEMAARPRVRTAFEDAGVPLASESGDDGVMLADGAGFVVLSAAPATRELAGWSHRIEPSDRCGIHGMKTASLCLDAALDKAGLPASALQSLHGHGNGNPRSDRSEAEWIAERRDLAGVTPFSWKRWTGHCLGASPVMELALNCHAMSRQAGDPPGLPSRPPLGWYGFGLWGYAAALVVR